jgi:hypothetical protein
MRYTEEQIGVAFKRYHQIMEPVIKLLGMDPRLNRSGIYTVASVSNDFLSIDKLVQTPAGEGIFTQIDTQINLCRESLLDNNSDWKKDKPLYDMFSNMPLNVETELFFFIAYDTQTFEYVEKTTTLVERLSHSAIMRTNSGVPFYLAMDKDISGKLPVIADSEVIH